MANGMANRDNDDRSASPLRALSPPTAAFDGGLRDRLPAGAVSAGVVGLVVEHRLVGRGWERPCFGGRSRVDDVRTLAGGPPQGQPAAAGGTGHGEATAPRWAEPKLLEGGEGPR
jgi:hypothetical protein